MQDAPEESRNEIRDGARGRGEKVVACCPFVRGWIERHPEYGNLLVGAS